MKQKPTNQSNKKTHPKTQTKPVQINRTEKKMLLLLPSPFQ